MGVEVHIDYPVMSGLPRADIIMIRKEEWTPEQLEFIPDGIRESNASHIIAEFKYSESVNEYAFRQTAAYEFFYQDFHKLRDEEIAIFLISSRTPSPSTLAGYGYVLEGPPGVFRSELPFLKRMPLLSLNDLERTPHNLLLKLFASKKERRMAALQALKKIGIASLPGSLRSYLMRLLKILFPGGEIMDDMDMVDMPEGKLTREELAEVAMVMAELLTPDQLLACFSLEERLAGFDPEDILARFASKDRLAGLGPEDRLAGLGPEDRLAGLGPEERLAGLGPKDVLAKFDPEDILAGLNPEDIEAYLYKVRGKGSRVET